MTETEFNIDTSIAQIVSSDIAYQYRIVPIQKTENKVLFKTDNLSIETLKQELQIVLGLSILLEKELLFRRK